MAKYPPLTDEEKLELLDSMTNEELRQGVLDGTYYILGASDTPGKPMVRWTAGPQKGRPVKGSGAPPGAAEVMTKVSIDNAYKRTGAYHALVERHWTPKLEWLFTQAEKMIEGGDVMVDAVCPNCDHAFKVKAYKKGDSQALKVVWEGVIGRATERKEVDVNIRALMARIDQRVPIESIEVVDVSPEEIQERMALAAAGEAVSDAYRE